MTKEPNFSEKQPRETVTHNMGVTVRLDWGTLQDLEKIALFEHDKRAPLMRRIIVEKVQVYLRNPAYKRFLKQLELKRAEVKKT